jgi:hypothetical protein
MRQKLDQPAKMTTAISATAHSRAINAAKARTRRKFCKSL